MRRTVILAATVCLIAVFAAGQSLSNPPTAQPEPNTTTVQSSAAATENAALKARLDALERKLDQLEKRVNEALPGPGAVAGAPVSDRLQAIDQKLQLLEQAKTQTKENPKINVGRDGFSISSADKNYRLRFGGLVQADGKTFYDDRTHILTDSFNLRRARPILEGSLGKYVDFKVMPDFGNGTSYLYDAYADVKFSPMTVLRGGKFKTPIGLENLQDDAVMTFIERSLANDLVPGRTVGFEVWGNIFDRMTYQVAATNGALDGTNIDADTHDSKDIVGRVFITPFKNTAMLKGLGFGVAASTGRMDNSTTATTTSLASYKTTGGQATFFSYATSLGLALGATNSASSSGGSVYYVTPAGTLAKQVTSGAIPVGNRLHFSPQLYYYVGPFGLLAEYAEVEQFVGTNYCSSSACSSVTKTVKHQLANHAYDVAASWVITGEKKSYKGVIPKTALEGGKWGMGRGAWELAARYTELDVDPNVFAFKLADPTKSAEAARTWTVGLNWYLNYFVTLKFNFEQTHFSKGACGATNTSGSCLWISNRPTEKVFEERLQFAF